MTAAADLHITMISVTVPVTLPPPRRKSRAIAREDPAIKLELYSDGCRVWDDATYTDCAECYSFRPKHAYDRPIDQMPFFEDVYRFLVSQHAAHRRDPIGDFLAPAVDAMDTALAARNGARVYFAKAGDRIKIGWSRKVGVRIAQLQTGNPAPVQLLATVPGARALERQLHTRFAEHRVSGEWFRDDPDLVTYIARLNAGHPS